MFDKCYCDNKDDIIRSLATQLFRATNDFDVYITMLRYWYINKLDLFYSLK
jgi:hypothetical protein